MRMNQLKAVKINRKIKTSPKVLKGGDVLELRIEGKVSINGINGGCVRIPQKFLKKLNWTPGKTEVYIALTDQGKLVVEPVEITQKATA